MHSDNTIDDSSHKKRERHRGREVEEAAFQRGSFYRPVSAVNDYGAGGQICGK